MSTRIKNYNDARTKWADIYSQTEALLKAQDAAWTRVGDPCGFCTEHGSCSRCPLAHDEEHEYACGKEYSAVQTKMRTARDVLQDLNVAAKNMLYRIDTEIKKATVHTDRWQGSTGVLTDASVSETSDEFLYTYTTVTPAEGSVQFPGQVTYFWGNRNDYDRLVTFLKDCGCTVVINDAYIITTEAHIRQAKNWANTFQLANILPEEE